MMKNAMARGQALNLAPRTRRAWAGRAIAGVAVCLLGAVVVQNAWVSEDAYITFRTVDNWLGGYGLVWNVGERVQSHTHPLWMFLIALASLFSSKIFYVSIFVSVAGTLAAMLVYAFGIARGHLAAVAGVAVLAFSKAFIDYSTSGLENPLTHLLAAVFFLLYLRGALTPRRFFFLSLVAGLAATNRMDTILLYLPALAVGLVRLRRVKAVLALAAGFAPFVLWEAFSLLYYGMLFPNTAYAKLNTGIGGWAMARQGMAYLLDPLGRDPLTLFTISAGVLLPMVTGERRKLAISAGIVLYLAYIVMVGGDFMAGRLLTAPLFCAVIVLGSSVVLEKKWLAAATAALAVVIGLLSPHPPLLTKADSGQDMKFTEIGDERAFYFAGAGLLNADKYAQMPNHPWATAGLAIRAAGLPVFVSRSVGYFGYFVGPKVYVIDTLALSDPLLARLPAMERSCTTWRIGHYDRQLPEGYVDTLRTGENRIRDPNLARYYDVLTRIIRGDLFDGERLAEIWRFNTGQYDPLLRAYEATQPQTIDAAQVDARSAQPGTLPMTLPPAGLQVELPAVLHDPELEIRLTAETDTAVAPYVKKNDIRGYLLLYRRGDAACVGQWLSAVPKLLVRRRTRRGAAGRGWARAVPDSAGFISGTLPVDPRAVEHGYDNIRILPILGLHPYQIAGLEFPGSPRPAAANRSPKPPSTMR